MQTASLSQHIIIFSWNDFAGLVIDELVKARRQVVVVTSRESNVKVVNDNVGNEQVHAVHIDSRDFAALEAIRIQDSAAVLLNFPDDTEKLTYLILLRKRYPQVRIIVSIKNEELKQTFYNSGVHYCISKEEISAKLLSSFLFERDVAAYSRDLLTTSQTNNEQDIRQMHLPTGAAFVGQTFQQAFFALYSDYNALLVGLQRGKELLKNPPSDLALQADDYLLLIASGKNADRLANTLNTHSG